MTTEDFRLVAANRPKNLRRRSSLEKIMHFCNQGYQMFPLMFLRVHDFQTSLSADLRKIIPFVKTLLSLRLGVYLSLLLLFLETFYCVAVVCRLSMPVGSVFLLGCICLLTLLAFQIFDVIPYLRKRLSGSFFVKKKVQ